jgi:hypothetical protein
MYTSVAPCVKRDGCASSEITDDQIWPPVSIPRATLLGGVEHTPVSFRFQNEKYNVKNTKTLPMILLIT